MVSDFKTFTNKRCKIVAQKKVCFWANFALLSLIWTAPLSVWFVEAVDAECRDDQNTGAGKPLQSADRNNAIHFMIHL